MGVKWEDMSTLLQASILYCREKKSGLTVYCNGCLKEAGSDDQTLSGSWCTACSNQTDFTSIPSAFTEHWVKAVSEGKKLGEIRTLIFDLVKKG